MVDGTPGNASVVAVVNVVTTAARQWVAAWPEDPASHSLQTPTEVSPMAEVSNAPAPSSSST
jgi:hypothetical protein